MVKRDKRNVTKTPVVRAKAPIDRRHALLGLVILLALFTYSNSFRAPFLLDNAEILNDTRVQSATSENVGRILRGPYHQTILTGLYRPLTSLSYLYNYAVRGDGTNPAGYHSFNFFVHAVNIAMVYALGLILFEDIPAALALAALWGLHPVQTEAVTNLVGRADMMAAFGVLAAIVAYHHALRTEGARRIALLAGIVVATAAGAFSKEIGVVALPAVILFDVLFAREVAWRRRIEGLAAVALPVALFLAVRARVVASLPTGPFPFTDNPIVGAGLVEGRITAFKVIGKYLGLLAWPATLSPDYSFNEIPVRVDVGGIVGLVLCLAAAVLALWSWRRGRALTFAIGLFFVALAPVANVLLVIGSIMGERFIYLPSVGFAAAVVYGAHRLWIAAPQRRNAITVAVAVVLAVFAFRAHARNEDWNDERQFWESAVRAVPGSFKPKISIIGSLPRNTPEGWQRGVAETQRALAILDPLSDEQNTGGAYRNAGVYFRAYGDHLGGAGAAEWYRRSLDALLRSERIERKLDEQYRAINEARGIKQGTYLPVAVYRELGVTYLKLKHLPNALQALEFGRNLASDPDLLEALASVYGEAGDLRKSAQALVEALAVDSSRGRVAERLIGLYKQIDPGGCAVQRDAGGESLNLGCPMVHGDICGASRNVARNYLQRNQTAEAASIRRVAINELGCPAAALD